MLSRRDFLVKGARAVAGAAIGASALGSGGCATTGGLSFGWKSIEERLKPENYSIWTKNWDPVHGPDLCIVWQYGGRADFKGHGNSSPGLDYDVRTRTPLVPAFVGFIAGIGVTTRASGLTLSIRSLANPNYLVSYLHLDGAVVSNDFITQTRSDKPFRVLKLNEIVALSGNSGVFKGGPQPQHLHFMLQRKHEYDEYLDPEKHGLDGEWPVFGDGETRVDLPERQKIPRLEKKLETLVQEVSSWPGELYEIKGRLIENHRLMGDVKGNKIVDSKHFQENRALLKKFTVEDKTYLPGTKPYSMMLALVAYSMVPPYSNQPVILSLPFIAPGITHKYQMPVYKKGPFYIRQDNRQDSTFKELRSN